MNAKAKLIINTGVIWVSSMTCYTQKTTAEGPDYKWLQSQKAMLYHQPVVEVSPYHSIKCSGLWEDSRDLVQMTSISILSCSRQLRNWGWLLSDIYLHLSSYCYYENVFQFILCLIKKKKSSAVKITKWSAAIHSRLHAFCFHVHDRKVFMREPI